MKKFVIFFVLLLIFTCIFAQEIQEDYNLVVPETDLNDFKDDNSFEDEFADLFMDAEDVDASEVEKKQENVTIINTGNSNIRVSGHFDGDLGLGYDFSKNDPFGYFVFSNELYVTIRPSDVFQLRGNLVTSYTNGFSLGLTTVYCDYAPFDFLFLSAGIKGISWGYTRIFSDADFYGNEEDKKYTGPLYTNILSDAGNYFVGEIRYPWSKGTVTGVVLCNYRGLGAAPGLKTLGYAFSSEMAIPHFCMNVFGRVFSPYEQQNYIDYNNEEYSKRKNPLAGVEGKLSVGGWDMYAQEILKVKQKSIYNRDKATVNGAFPITFYEQSILTCGFYKLWDKYDPNFGINIEYQLENVPGFNSNVYRNRIAAELGIKRMGRNKNLKSVFTWNHNFDEKYGQVSGSFIVGGAFPYADWQNTVYATYGQGGKVQMKIASTISMDINY